MILKNGAVRKPTTTKEKTTPQSEKGTLEKTVSEQSSNTRSSISKSDLEWRTNRSISSNSEELDDGIITEEEINELLEECFQCQDRNT